MVASLPSTQPVGVLAVASLGLATAIALAVRGVTLGRATVLAAAPWMVVGGILEALASFDVYRGLIAVVVAPPQVHLSALVLAGLTWVPLVEAARVRDREDDVEWYLGTSGVGVGLVLLSVLLWRASVGPFVVVWLVVVPGLAAIFAGGAYVLLGLGDADPLAYTGLVGWLVVFAHVFDGLAVALAVEVFGRVPRAPLASILADVVLDATARLVPSLPVRPPVGWLFMVAKLLGGLVVVQVAARTARRAPTTTYLAMGAIAAAGLGPGVATLLSLVVT